jgi:hypothetical protein
MKAAKIITFIAFISNGLLTAYSLFIFLKLQQLSLEVEIPKTGPFLILPIFTIGSLIYWFYLRNKERRGQVVNFALWISIALLLIPFMVFFPVILIWTSQPSN